MVSQHPLGRPRSKPGHPKYMPHDIPFHAVVHARMSSARLPGKVMMRVQGTPLLGHLIDRLQHCPDLDGMVIATSTRPEDDAVADYAATRGVACFRGDLDDVAARVVAAARQHGINHLARISGDSPMLDPAILTLALQTYRREQPDLVTNVQQRTYPKGQSVELFSRDLLERALSEGMSAADREHVTPWFYRHPGRYLIRNLAYPGLKGDVQLSVDSAEDLARFERMLARLAPPFWQHGLETLLQTLDTMTAAHEHDA